MRETKNIISKEKELDEWMYEKWDQEQMHEPSDYINRLTSKLIKETNEEEEG